MPVSWGNNTANVLEFQHNKPTANVKNTATRKNKLSNLRNRRMIPSIPRNNVRRQALTNPLYNPSSAAWEAQFGVNAPQRYATGNNAYAAALELERNVYGPVTPPLPNTPESTRRNNVWTPPLNSYINVNMNNWRSNRRRSNKNTNKNTKSRALKTAKNNNMWTNLNL